MTKTVTCCFTGPRKLPAGGAESAPEISLLKSKLTLAVRGAYDEGYRFFMSGMAEGFDLMAAETVLKLKSELPDIRLCAVFPAPESRVEHQRPVRDRIEKILLKADLIVYVQNKYSFGCEKLRNIYMADSSERVIGYYNGLSSGTAHCWKYAEGLGLEMINLFDGEIFE